ncbi:hypothetical protein TIFTF001_010984 [Ficus carica]|uniref:Uncharacterized protein n=1 Tax=Ficus carica TaxID=3494 RepID=A0AA88AD72_FICCA|nr:hypothetical protein TIFTF001_010984 [Ficus carica]
MTNLAEEIAIPKKIVTDLA